MVPSHGLAGYLEVCFSFLDRSDDNARITNSSDSNRKCIIGNFGLHIEAFPLSPTTVLRSAHKKHGGSNNKTKDFQQRSMLESCAKH